MKVAMGKALRMYKGDGHGKLSSQRAGDVKLENPPATCFFRIPKTASRWNRHQARVSAIRAVDGKAIKDQR
jgi:hypothetical protein